MSNNTFEYQERIKMTNFLAPVARDKRTLAWKAVAEPSRKKHHLLWSFIIIQLIFQLAKLLPDLPGSPGAPDFDHLRPHCSSILPIQPAEFHHRQLTLARTLHTLGVLAYIAEPGPNTLYYANISAADWRTSERPFLLIIKPIARESDAVEVELAVITPKFEATRAGLLTIPSESGNIIYASWAEDVNPYDVTISTIVGATKEASEHHSIMIDENARYFVVSGLETSVRSRWKVEITSKEVRQIREKKSAAEIQIMRCANEVTLMAIRAVRDAMYIGIKESEGRTLIRKALLSAGLVGGGALVLFGENAALPHGSGTDRPLGVEDFALFDVGGSLHGYTSDITRTFALEDSKIPTARLEIWYTVHAAQQAAHKAAREGVLASAVDGAARNLITDAGAGKYFTHRLGHGIGLEGHEAPYLRGGYDIPLAKGNSFSNEPGIYIPSQIGVRLEDVFIINEDGVAEFLTANVGGVAISPWRI